MTASILEKLDGGDLRSIGRGDEVLADLERDPGLLEPLVKGMLHDDPRVRMRAADAVEKYSAANPGVLQPYKRLLLERIARIEQQEVRWHAAQMIPRLDLTGAERDQSVDLLVGYLHDKSRIVKTFAMQALADLAGQDERLRERVLPLLEECTRAGSPAMQSRGKKILDQLNRKATGGKDGHSGR